MANTDQKPVRSPVVPKETIVYSNGQEFHLPFVPSSNIGKPKDTKDITDDEAAEQIANSFKPGMRMRVDNFGLFLPRGLNKSGNMPAAPRTDFSRSSTDITEIESGDPVRSRDHGICDYDGDDQEIIAEITEQPLRLIPVTLEAPIADPDNRFSEATRYVINTLKL